MKEKNDLQIFDEDELLNPIYREISERLGINAARTVHGLFKGQQITFPMRLFSDKSVREMIAQEYDGSNIKALAAKYNYSEKSIRRMLKDCIRRK